MSKNHEGKDSQGRSGSQIRQVQEAISRRPFGWEWMWSLGITAAAGVGGVTAKEPLALTHQSPSARAPTARPRKEKIPKDANTATCSKGSL